MSERQKETFIHEKYHAVRFLVYHVNETEEILKDSIQLHVLSTVFEAGDKFIASNKGVVLD